MNQLILFDCDGTLTDSNGAIVQSIVHAFCVHGLTAPEPCHILKALGKSLNIVVDSLLREQGYDAHQHLIEPIAEAYRKHYQQLESDVLLYPNVEKVLKTLKQRGYWMAIVTGKSKSGLERVLEKFQLNQYFYTYKTADCGHSKPHPEMALACMDELGIEPQYVTLVGDSHADMQMAKHAGALALGACFDYDLHALELKRHGAQHIVYHFEELLDFFPALA